jgi:hypothetical protein
MLSPPHYHQNQSLLRFSPETGWGFLLVGVSVEAAAAAAPIATAAANLPFCAKVMPPP